MKITIEFEKTSDPELPCRAFSKVPPNGEFMCTHGVSWDDARKRHIAKVKKLEDFESPPASEEIEI